ncbi:hypothetical protein [Flavisolibacter ginsenosidimutans]|uniref:Uncharacterized protein n=1 Tax=Flavisolibacter ginsenosidimutans TaxID=661481 RepID=A0A5B8UDT0_9BACT|nr:hypothetical protein [Flavisolibacter ginsenosidimutans]QEC54724.1 hypothetical protein FSB75_02015 [Flavisolibacter ginsenosidimutans]
MKDRLHLFVIFTLLEISLSALYYLLVQRIDSTLFIGAVLYAGAMTANYFSYRTAVYQKRRKEMLDALP